MRRIRRLEKSTDQTGVCSGCGYAFVPKEKTEWRVVFAGDPDDPLVKRSPNPPSKYPPCRLCGRVDGKEPIDVVFTLQFDRDG